MPLLTSVTIHNVIIDNYKDNFTCSHLLINTGSCGLDSNNSVPCTTA